MQSSYEKDQRIRQLENENRMLQEKVNLLEHNVEILTQAVLHAAKQRFGASSEKTPPIYGQCFLFGELIDQSPDEAENIKEHKRPVRKKGDREKLIQALPHEVVECILNEEEAVCKIYLKNSFTDYCEAVFAVTGCVPFAPIFFSYS
jgi:hypothetical protein